MSVAWTWPRRKSRGQPSLPRSGLAPESGHVCVVWDGSVFRGLHNGSRKALPGATAPPTQLPGDTSQR